MSASPAAPAKYIGNMEAASEPDTMDRSVPPVDGKLLCITLACGGGTGGGGAKEGVSCPLGYPHLDTGSCKCYRTTDNSKNTSRLHRVPVGRKGGLWVRHLSGVG